MGFNVVIPTTSWVAKQRIRNGDDLAVLYHATGCGHCAVLAQTLSGVLDETSIDVLGIDVAFDRALAGESAIDGTPTLILYSNGAETGRLSGTQDAETLLAFLSGGDVGDEEGDEGEEEDE